MGLFDRRKNKKATSIVSDSKLATEDKLQAEYEQIMKAKKEEERAAEERVEEAIRDTVEMSGRLSQLDNSPGHKKAMDVAQEQAKKFFGKNSVEDKTKADDDLEFRKFSDWCERVTNPENGISIRTMYSRFQALKEANVIEDVDSLMYPYALDMELEDSDNPSQALNNFMSKKLSTGKTVRDNISVKKIYSAALVAEAIGLVRDHRRAFPSMYDSNMREAVTNEMGYNTIYHPIDDMMEHLNLVAYQGIMERKGLKVADYTRRGIDKGVGAEEVQQAKSTIRTAMLSRDPNKEDRNAK